MQPAPVAVHVHASAVLLRNAKHVFSFSDRSPSSSISRLQRSVFDRDSFGVYTYIMQRTQIYLGEVEARILDRLARRTGRTRSQLIREAIEAAYVDARSPQAIEAALVETAGSWRRSGSSGAAWVERRRRGRLSKLHRGS